VSSRPSQTTHDAEACGACVMAAARSLSPKPRPCSVSIAQLGASAGWATLRFAQSARNAVTWTSRSQSAFGINITAGSSRT
jgi:hypothetical protein